MKLILVIAMSLITAMRFNVQPALNNPLHKLYVFLLFILTLVLPFNGNASEPKNPLQGKIHRESKAEQKRNGEFAMQFMPERLSNQRLFHVIHMDSIRSVFIPQNTKISDAQVLYLMQHAVFKKREDLKMVHLLPMGHFKLTLLNDQQFEFSLFAAAIVQMKVDGEIFWLEVPDSKQFDLFGNGSQQ